MSDASEYNTILNGIKIIFGVLASLITILSILIGALWKIFKISDNNKKINKLLYDQETGDIRVQTIERCGDCSASCQEKISYQLKTITDLQDNYTDTQKDILNKLDVIRNESNQKIDDLKDELHEALNKMQIHNNEAFGLLAASTNQRIDAMKTLLYQEMMKMSKDISDYLKK